MKTPARHKPSLVRLAFAAFILTLTPALADVPASAYSDLHWRLVGPFRGGWATAVAGIPGDPSTFYFGGADGGVWKTTGSDELAALLDFQRRVATALERAVRLAAQGDDDARSVAAVLTSLASDLESADRAPTQAQRDLFATAAARLD